MPLTNLDAHYRQLMDPLVDPLLEEFHHVAEAKDAMAALEELSKVVPAPDGARNYSPLPEELKAPSLAKIQGVLQQLHHMMQNQQPEQRIGQERGDDRPEVRRGIFGLAQRPTATQAITSDLVHQYLRDKFAVKIQTLNLLSLGVVARMLNTWKEKQPALYFTNLVSWVAQEGEGMPKDMQTILQSRGILQKAIQQKIKDNLPKISEEEVNALAIAVMAEVLALPPELLDPDASAIADVYRVQPMRGDSSSPQAAALEQKDDGSPQAAALKEIKKQLRDKKGVSPTIIPLCKSFLVAERAYRLVKKHGLLLSTLEGMENPREVGEIAESYLKQIANPSPPEPRDLDPQNSNILTRFLEHANACLAESSVDQVENFFALYFRDDDRDTRDRLWITLIDLAFMQRKIFTDDVWLGRTTEALLNPETREVDVTPYYVNRVLLHACLVPPSSWTPSFSGVFGEVLNLLRELEGANLLNRRLKQSSYPVEFVAQLHWLARVYKTVHPDAAAARVDAGDQPATHFPLLAFPDFGPLLDGDFGRLLHGDFGRLLRGLTPEQCAAVYESMKEHLPSIIKTGLNFGDALRYLPPAQRAAVYESMKDRLPSIIETGTNFGEALS